MSNQERIACAALRHPPTGLVICSPRHGGPTVYRIIAALNLDGEFEQGFCTNQFDRFVDRQEAHKIATAAGQIIYRCGGDDDTLYSENLY